ncbi:MAG: hypothetical protein QNJ98_14555 [Planctomycetota bacterium]|nr:hypothetical protein [Planctomycetota bacterium]
MANGSSDSVPFWHRSKLRWVNGLGFAMSLALALWLLLATAGNLLPSQGNEPMPYPLVYMVAGGAALIATVVLFGIILFRFLWRGVDFSEYTPRVYLFLWSIGGLLFFVLQALLMWIFGKRSLPNVADWAQEFIWFLCPFGVMTFAILAYVNSELPHDHDEDWDEHHEDWEDHIHDEGYEG